MDTEVSGWIIEFLLRQNSLDDRSLNDLIRVLPLPNTNPRLKKCIILRKILSDIEKGTVSGRTIKYLEQIEELDLRVGNVEVSEATKTAYITVAMHFIAKSIEENAGDKKEKHVRAVKRIWNGRIRKMEMSDVVKRVGLVQDDLLRLENGIEAGVLHVDVCENVVAKFKALDVLEALRRYVNEAKEKMGPSFLELAFETILSDRELSKIMGLDEGVKPSNQIKNGAPTVVPDVSQDVDANANDNSKANDEGVKHNNQSKNGAPTVILDVSQDVDTNANDNSKANDASRVHVLPRHKNVPPRCSRGPGHGPRRGAKIVDPLETSHHIHDSIPTPVFNKVQKDLETSSFELRAVVKDPLADALCLAESLKANKSGETMIHDHVVGNSNRVNIEAPSSSHDRNNKGLEANGNKSFCKAQNKRPKLSLMERNITAHTIEWNDSIDGSEKGSPTRPHLPSPKKRAVSPLSVYKIEQLAKKRMKKRWTVIEEDTLRTGVQKYGKGNWKLILSLYRDIFVDRTEVDLKDKWRNLTR